MQRLLHLSDAELVSELRALVGSHRRVTAELVAHLGEVDARRLHVDKGFPSLFAYCVQELSFSEDEACRRIDAARLARRFPAVLSFLEIPCPMCRRAFGSCQYDWIRLRRPA
jgi:hypothetical protein